MHPLSSAPSSRHRDATPRTLPCAANGALSCAHPRNKHEDQKGPQCCSGGGPGSWSRAENIHALMRISGRCRKIHQSAGSQNRMNNPGVSRIRPSRGHATDAGPLLTAICAHQTELDRTEDREGGVTKAYMIKKKDVVQRVRIKCVSSAPTPPLADVSAPKRQRC